MKKKCDGVFEGGGVKGIGLVGAVKAVEEAGYEFENVAGTSAGSIAASLIAAGYTGDEIHDELLKVNLKNFSQGGFLTALGPPGKALKLLVKSGIYTTDYFEQWLNGLLNRKGKNVFGNIKTGYANPRHQYKFQAIASDITSGDMLILPGDLSKFGLNPDKFSIARAVRMSISIPVYYEPIVLTDVNGQKHLVVDGGLLSNYPVWLLDDRTNDPPWPTFGFRFNSDEGKQSAKTGAGVIELAKSVARTAMDGIDKHYISISKGDFARTISISSVVSEGDSTKNISTVYFGIKPEESESLFKNGLEAGKKFLSGWNFDNWKAAYRNVTG